MRPLVNPTVEEFSRAWEHQAGVPMSRDMTDAVSAAMRSPWQDVTFRADVPTGAVDAHSGDLDIREMSIRVRCLPDGATAVDVFHTSCFKCQDQD